MNATVMANRKRTKQDTRSAITFHLPVAHADYIVRLLASELDNVRREGQKNQEADILEIWELIHNAMEFEERQRSLRGKADGKRQQKNQSETENETEKGG
jgi:hypothetical protein|nr:hypothetical protein [uncultured Acetatifactor sp.]